MALAAASEALGLPAQSVTVGAAEVEQMLPLGGTTQLTTQLTESERTATKFASKSIRT